MPEQLVRALGRNPREVLKSRDYFAVFDSQADVASLATLVERMAALDAFPPYRRLDHHFHIAVASAARSQRLSGAQRITRYQPA